jgi:hypothetical protein
MAKNNIQFILKDNDLGKPLILGSLQNLNFIQAASNQNISDSNYLGTSTGILNTVDFFSLNE